MQSKTNPATPNLATQGRQAVLYARVSSKDQEREGFSIPAQQVLLRGYAGANAFTIVQEFVDVETAKQAGRASFGEMVSYLQKHQACRVVLVEKPTVSTGTCGTGSLSTNSASKSIS